MPGFHKPAKKSSFGQKVSSFFSSAWNWITGTAKKVWNGVKSVINTAHKDVQQLVSGVGNIVVHTEDVLTGTVQSVVHDAKNLGVGLGDSVAKTASSLSMPLAIGGIALAAMFLMK